MNNPTQINPDKLWESYISLAHKEKQLGNASRCEDLLIKALQQAETLADHRLIESLDTLASLYRDQGNYASAESFYRRSLKLKEAMWGQTDPRTLFGVRRLARLLRDLKHTKEAEDLYLHSITTMESSRDHDSLEMGTLLCNLAIFYQEQGKNNCAKQTYEKLMQIDETSPTLISNKRLAATQARLLELGEKLIR